MLRCHMTQSTSNCFSSEEEDPTNNASMQSLLSTCTVSIGYKFLPFKVTLRLGNELTTQQNLHTHTLWSLEGKEQTILTISGHTMSDRCVGLKLKPRSLNLALVVSMLLAWLAKLSTFSEAATANTSP